MATLLRLRALRIAGEYTLTDVGREAGISSSYVGALEQGRVRPTQRVTSALAHFFRVDGSTLFDTVKLTVSELRQ